MAKVDVETSDDRKTFKVTIYADGNDPLTFAEVMGGLEMTMDLVDEDREEEATNAKGAH